MMKDFMKHDFNIDKIVLACLVKAGTGKNVHRNRASYGLALFLNGERTIVFENSKKVTAKENTIVYFPKGSDYVVKNQVVGDCYAINFDMPEDITFEPFAVKVKNGNLFLDSFKTSQKIWTKKNPGYVMKVKSELYNIIYNLQKEYGLPYSRFSKIQPALDYIHSHYDKENISISYLASLCDMSTVYLRSHFVKNFGIPPIKYINDLKMQRAEELLASGQYAVREVCFLSGFFDESYFSREFSRHTGVSPKNYIKTAKAE